MINTLIIAVFKILKNNQEDLVQLFGISGISNDMLVIESNSNQRSSVS